MENLKLLLTHMKWADAEVWKNVFAFEASETDERIKKLLYHIHQVQYAFCFIWKDMPVKIPDAASFENLKSIARWGYDFQNLLDSFSDSLTEEILRKIVVIPWSKLMERIMGKEVSQVTMEETILQVVSHSSYHRGQVNARLRELGGEPPIVDFIAWTWLAKPAADWRSILE